MIGTGILARLDILNYYFWAATVPSRAANDRSAIQVLADLIRIQALSKVSLMSGKTLSSNSFAAAGFGIFCILVGCCLNVITLEFITKRDPGAGSFITFAQFLFIACEGFVQHFRWPLGLKPRQIPISVYVLLTAILFVLSIINNLALGYDISVPLHTVFRSSSLAGSLFVGMFFFGKKYSRAQIVSCIVVTVGICVITLADARMPLPSASSSSDSSAPASSPPTALDCCSSSNPFPPLSPLSSPFYVSVLSLFSSQWAIGVCMLLFALCLSATLGHLQDRSYKIYGKAWKESMFYSHALALPAFVTVLPSLYHRLTTWALEPPVVVNLAMGQLHLSLFTLLALNIATQWICIRGVFVTTSATSTLTCTFVITLRKFVSLIFSIIYFNNPFTELHWAGAILVFIGAACYRPGSSSPSPSPPTDQDQSKSASNSDGHVAPLALPPRSQTPVFSLFSPSTHSFEESATPKDKLKHQ